VEIRDAMDAVDTRIILHKANERRSPPDATQTTSRCSVSDADEVISQFLNDGDGLRLLNRADIYGNQDGLLRFDEDTAVGLISLTSHRRSGE